MAGLVCDICGGKLMSDEDGEIFTCESCGTRFPKERVKKMFAEISGTVRVENAVSAESLCKRAELALEDGDFRQATEYFNKVLDIDPEYAPAYVGMLMAENRVRQEGDLVNLTSSISRSGNYQKALRFGDATLQGRLEGYSRTIDERVAVICKAEQERREAAEKAEQERIEAERRETERIANIISSALSQINDKTTCDAARIRIADIHKTMKDIWSQMTELAINNPIQYGLGGLPRALRRKREEAVNAFIDCQNQLAALAKEKDELRGVSVEWQALELDEINHRILIIAKNCVTLRRFDIDSNVWGDSEIRRWLNSEFLNSLPDVMNRRVLEVQIQVNESITTDRIFLLSREEAQKYFSDNVSRIVKNEGMGDVRYMLGVGMGSWLGHEMGDKVEARIMGAYGAACWWLRSHGNNSNRSEIVNVAGGAINDGLTVNTDGCGVRPAFWLNLDS